MTADSLKSPPKRKAGAHEPLLPTHVNGDKNGNESKTESKLLNGNGRVNSLNGRKHGRMKERCNPGALCRFALEDWFCLALLGVLMAVISVVMDIAIENLQSYHIILVAYFRDNVWPLPYLVWVSYVVMLVVASALCAHFIAPQAIGSGIPEMKSILRGVVLKEYLSFRTLVSKILGLTLSLGSGLPIGKEGPFVHVASVLASQLNRMMNASKGVFENESSNSEMLAAGCAVGVACTFSAPVGGVLFSIEVTSVLFAVRNYWRGFFAAACSATLFRVLKCMRNFDQVLSVEAHFQTHFPPSNAFVPAELPLFAVIGVLCGLLGALYIYMHRSFVVFLRDNSLIQRVFSRHWLAYSVFVAFLISSVTFPLGIGRYLGGEQKFSHTLSEFFSERSWFSSETAILDVCWAASSGNGSMKSIPVDITHWIGSDHSGNIFISILVFHITYFMLCILSSTLPVPAGTFMPVFILGASLGRLFGEGMALAFPNGIEAEYPTIYPGVYAIVGAAAFCGAVTHTVSVAVIVFELTGQLATLLPVMIAVLIANGVCSHLQPSIYDSIIRIKNLPYLPNIPHTTLVPQISAQQFMITSVIYVARDSTFRELQSALFDMPSLRAFPLVDSKQSMLLLGSISRAQILALVDGRLGVRARQNEATRRINERIKKNEYYARPRPVESLTTTEKTRFTVVPLEEIGSKKRDSVVSDPYTTMAKAEKELYVMGMKRVKTDDNMKSDHSHHTLGTMFRSISRLSFGKRRRGHADSEFDLHGDERIAWEEGVLNEHVDLSLVAIDPAPFQLVHTTSLFKVHSLFSLLGLNRTYVTNGGRLVGVITLKELRIAIERTQAGIVLVECDRMCDGQGDGVDSIIGNQEYEPLSDNSASKVNLLSNSSLLSQDIEASKPSTSVSNILYVEPLESDATSLLRTQERK